MKLNTYTIIDYVSSSHSHNRERESALRVHTYIETGDSDCTARKRAIETMSEIILRKFIDYNYYLAAMIRDLDRDDDFNVLINGVDRYEAGMGYLSDGECDNVHNILDELNNEAITLAVEKYEKYKTEKANKESAAYQIMLNVKREKDLEMLSELQAKYGAGAGAGAGQ